MKSWLVLVPFFFAGLAIVARAERPHDIQNTTEFADIILTQLKTGQFDALESEYQDFRDVPCSIQSNPVASSKPVAKPPLSPAG